MSLSLAQTHREDGDPAASDGSDSVKVLTNSHGSRLVVSTDVLFISLQYSIVIAVDITPSMLQVVSRYRFTHTY